MSPKSLPIYGQAASRYDGERRRWRSLEELHDGTRSAPGEFAPGAADPPPLSRRGFLKILGGSAALAGIEACAPPRERILPFVRQPPEIQPGKALHYATALGIDGYATGLVVTCNEGRPTKVEGNPAHPTSLGAAGTFEQATLLDLYDPSRAEGIYRQGRAMAHRTFLVQIAALGRALASDGGARLRFLVAPSASPIAAEMRRRILTRFPKARFHAYTALPDDTVREGTRLAFGRPLDVRYHLEPAAVILSLDADLLGGHGEALRLSREFAAHRDPKTGMSRLYVAEASLSITGGCADHRLRMRSSEVLGFAQAVAGQLASRHGLSALAPLGGPHAGAGTGSRWAVAVADDLARNRGRCVVAVGPRQPAALHALADAMNYALGNLGKTVTLARPLIDDLPTGPESLWELGQALDAGQVDTLVITAWNPVYTAPGDIDLPGLLRRARNTIYHSMRADETWRSCSWTVAASHPFESWGDARARDGTVTIAQPLIAPLLETVSEVDFLSAFVDQGALGAHAILRGYWRSRSGRPDFDALWDRWLSEGVVPGTAELPEPPPPLQPNAIAATLSSAAPRSGGLELSFIPDYKAHDGRFVANAWLEELPDPITKITWDNAAYLSPLTAGKLHLDNADVAVITHRGRKIEAPVWILPGHADDAVTLALGYGHSVGGPVEREVGYNAYTLRHADAPWFDAGATIAPAGRRHALGVTQGHFSMEGRPDALEYTLAEWRSRGQKEIERYREPNGTLQQPVDYSKETYKWGMAIDLSRCTGCSACVIACQEENNIPVVGREQVIRAREMHWLRIDRYFSGSADEPDVVVQPVLCMHCEAAPCEYVCPVNATVHSDEGLNEMVYNRCVGTRYCSNNCPYKVRRFNYLDFRGRLSPTQKMLMNPDVTVRTRGVMEKCTYCVQRIERARIDTRVAGPNQKIRDGEVRTACQQACPAEAIVFGNLNDPQSKVSRLHQDHRTYALLNELGTRPRTRYLAKLRNPNPDLA